MTERVSPYRALALHMLWATPIVVALVTALTLIVMFGQWLVLR